jgi:hypothetical protein
MKLTNAQQQVLDTINERGICRASEVAKQYRTVERLADLGLVRLIMGWVGTPEQIEKLVADRDSLKAEISKKLGEEVEVMIMLASQEGLTKYEDTLFSVAVRANPTKYEGKLNMIPVRFGKLGSFYLLSL